MITKDEAQDALRELTKVPDDLSDIQSRPSQVWNCDEIGIDPNGKWNKVIYTRKFCETEKVWKVVQGEHAP